MNEIELEARASYMPKNFHAMLTTYLHSADKVTEAIIAVAAVREPEKYGDAAQLLKDGRLFPRIQTQLGGLRIALIDAETGESIGDIFEYHAPALQARGVAN